MNHCAAASKGLSWLLFIMLSSLPYASQGQNKPTGPSYGKKHRFAYTAVVPIAGTSQAELVLRARAWAQHVTPSGQPPVITSGLDSTIVQTTGFCTFAYEREDMPGETNLSTLRYTATISLREGRYRYKVTDFVLLFPSTGKIPIHEIPAESYFNGNVKPLHASAVRGINTIRTCVQEVSSEVLAHLEADMGKQTSPNGSK
ncbi:hypothetical protein [Hymenobacter latericus]|uniref:hypothetical protein n=1 Tax=Hymenobacter sp. YIM 151858-1 TaxID=2987688 RepID=UPI0022270D06|nr:hypothetical protein [Hymenobacter sp. YIM 151858-1]UYZ60266.1 hypothetical protein OIS50_05555 [Hymenobacter sp. YIM 151858-1]